MDYVIVDVICCWTWSGRWSAKTWFTMP